MGEETGHTFGVIDRFVRAQTKLIEDLLEVSRINSGKLGVSPRAIQLHTVMEAVWPSEHAWSIRLENDSDVLPELHGDPDRLQQVAFEGLSVLLIEDDADARVMLAALLRRLVATVTTADSVRRRSCASPTTRPI